jgi:hypothetical protein
MEDKPKRVPCKRIFSNGTEFELFQEQQCDKCKRFRNGKCRIFNKIMLAMFDETQFPYDDLLDWDNGYGGKACKSFTDEPVKHIRQRKEIEGQIVLEDLVNETC